MEETELTNPELGLTTAQAEEKITQGLGAGMGTDTGKSDAGLPFYQCFLNLHCSSSIFRTKMRS